jgi:hypothetical protein
MLLVALLVLLLVLLLLLLLVLLLPAAAMHPSIHPTIQQPSAHPPIDPSIVAPLRMLPSVAHVLPLCRPRRPAALLVLCQDGLGRESAPKPTLFSSRRCHWLPARS